MKFCYKDQRITKSSQLVPEDAELVIKEPQKYVGRGGYKLEKALEVFNLNPNRLIGVDIGASTGGFTDCLLQNGAYKVYCVDVGYGQLATSLINDDRVVQMDRTNARNLKSDDFPEPSGMCCC
ncbi:MAG: SAM-dependent methyltransferase [Caldisericia bacterium]